MTVSEDKNDPCRFRNQQGFVPRKPEDDFGDGGAFPEIHVPQYPLGMGKKDCDTCSEIDTVLNKYEVAVAPEVLSDDAEETDDDKLRKKTTEATKNALLKRMCALQMVHYVPKQSTDSEFIKYRPSQQQGTEFKSRIIRMVEKMVDPLEPPKFKHEKVPRGSSGSLAVPLMHSPPRAVKDQQEWKIPPCVSNWKNPKGYAVPLDKRLVADGRWPLQDVLINDNFANLSEALYVSEQKAREAVVMRLKVVKEMVVKEKEKKERELLALAVKARSETERTGVARDTDMDCRDKIREERRRERESERRLEAKIAVMGKKRKITRDRNRDVSEKVALGMASVGEADRGEVRKYDERLFNQEKGMESGFAADDQYNVYDKGLFTLQSLFSNVYQRKKGIDNEIYGGAVEQLDKIRKTDRFKSDKGFTGVTEKSGQRDKTVEFEEVAEEADPFSLAQWLTELKQGKKAME